MGEQLQTLHNGFRRSVALFVALVMAFVGATGIDASHVRAFSGDGSGVNDDPYLISTCAQLLEISADLDASYVLADSIDCTSVAMSPIGTNGTPFTGNFDGQGHTISDVSISSASSYTGIFGFASNAVITDVRLEDVTISGTGDVGGLVGGTYYATISYISGKNITVQATGNNAGGLVGQLGGSSIERSYVEAVDVSSTADMVGGLIGLAVGPTTVSDAYAAGEVNADTTVGGVIGQLGAGPAFSERLYADVLYTGLAGSQVVGAVAFGATAGSSFIANGSYIGTSTVGPLNTWDFTNVWYVRAGAYPSIRPATLPVLQCNMPTSTNTSITASCTSFPLLESGATQWELRYGYDDETERTALTSQSGQLFNVTIPVALEGTDYTVEFRYVDTLGTSQWGSIMATTTGLSDVDGDTVNNKAEYLGPNGGDADNDGTLDYTQAAVTGFKNSATNSYTVLKTACNDNYNVQHGLESSAQKDAAFDYPAGLLGFVIRGCGVGATVPIEVLYYGNYDASSFVARKANNGVYSAIPNATFSTITIGGSPALKLKYSITDGSALDDDGVADGAIVDPVGIALKAGAVGVPNTGFETRK